MTVLGEDVHVSDEVYNNVGVVLPQKEIKTSILNPQIVMGAQVSIPNRHVIIYSFFLFYDEDTFRNVHLISTPFRNDSFQGCGSRLAYHWSMCRTFVAQIICKIFLFLGLRNSDQWLPMWQVTEAVKNFHDFPYTSRDPLF
ncbi:hypothetical protein O6H91_11G059600 [Diphasiastrum complanatum]|uniref:Uncharacterized protein n=1 Tax=Diphasiastrum complanatum TaxID=34168 RepID=A0ACC2C9J9_DIPCM|nr:hypothetical protein O6H91_11G059600 [Diphasiastrum complanatum]